MTSLQGPSSPITSFGNIPPRTPATGLIQMSGVIPAAQKERDPNYKPPLFRSGRRNELPGSVSISSKRGGAALPRWATFMPNERMFVQWRLPTEIYNKCKLLSVALQWYGAINNHQNIVSKKLSASGKKGDVCGGEIQFFAPKGAGIFVYRLFDADTDNSSLVFLVLVF